MMLRKAALLCVFLLVLCVIPLFTQTAQKVEDLLNTDTLSWSGAALFALEAGEKAALTDPEEAFRFALEREWLPKKSASGESARLNGVALLLMNAFDLKGGLLYSIFKNPHYAYRELVYKEVIQGKTDPEMTVPGSDFLFMINRILAMKDAAAGADAAGIAREREQEAERLRAEQEAARIRAEQEKIAQEINTRLAAQNVADTEASVTEEGITISLSDIQFMANSAELTGAEKIKLEEIARILETVAERNLLVTGHTAQAGEPEAQLRTSRARAQAVADYLVLLGARTQTEISVRGFGAEMPVADNSTEEGMALNRRVVITILPAGGKR